MLILARDGYARASKVAALGTPSHAGPRRAASFTRVIHADAMMPTRREDGFRARRAFAAISGRSLFRWRAEQQTCRDARVVYTCHIIATGFAGALGARSSLRFSRGRPQHHDAGRELITRAQPSVFRDE